MESKNAAIRFNAEVVQVPSGTPVLAGGIEQRSDVDAPSGMFWKDGSPVLNSELWRLFPEQGC